MSYHYCQKCTLHFRFFQDSITRSQSPSSIQQSISPLSSSQLSAPLITSTPGSNRPAGLTSSTSVAPSSTMNHPATMSHPVPTLRTPMPLVTPVPYIVDPKYIHGLRSHATSHTTTQVTLSSTSHLDMAHQSASNVDSDLDSQTVPIDSSVPSPIAALASEMTVVHMQNRGTSPIVFPDVSISYKSGEPLDRLESLA